MAHTREPPRCYPVVATPIIREFEKVAAGRDVKLSRNALHDFRVAINLPEARDQVHIRKESVCRDAVSEIVCVWGVIVQLERVDAAVECAKRVYDAGGRQSPELVVVFAEHTAGNTGEEYDN